MAETRWRITYRNVTVADPDKLIAAIQTRMGKDTQINTIEDALEWPLECTLDKPIDHGIDMGTFNIERLP